MLAVRVSPTPLVRATAVVASQFAPAARRMSTVEAGRVIMQQAPRRMTLVRREFEEALRKGGLAPSVLFGTDASGAEQRVGACVRAKDITGEAQRLGQSLLNTVYDVNFEGEDHTVRCVIRSFSRHPVDRSILESSLMLYYPEAVPQRSFEFDIPIVHYNLESSPAIKRGSFLQAITYKLRCRCAAPLLPQRFLINVGGRDSGARIRALDLQFPPGIEPVDPEQLLVKFEGNSELEDARNKAYKKDKERRRQLEEYWQEESSE